ncbi:MAG: molecular chaperone DnaJ [Gammaproteobacteria bacterium]|nr:molecular chaperone DnaJ [Gammaproteobacteria bacterium]
MIIILAGVLGGVAFVLLVRLLWAKTKTQSRLKTTSFMITTAAIVLVVALALLAATGRIHWLAAAGAAIFPFLRRALSALPLLRFLPMLQARFGGRGPTPGAAGAGPSRHSEVATGELKMTLHHDSGHMDGEVLTGKHRGQLLSELELAQVMDLRSTLQEQESVRLLETYLDRHFPGWSAEGGDASGANEPGRNGNEDMGRAHALEVLGLEANATNDQIIETHRRLIQRLHPDRGGSDFLAATLNEAKRVLLGSRRD